MAFPEGYKNITSAQTLEIQQWDGGPLTFGIEGTFDNTVKIEFQTNIRDLDPITVEGGTFSLALENLPAVKIADLDSAMHYTFEISGAGTYDVSISVTTG